VAHHLLSPWLPLLILPSSHVAVDCLTRPHCSHRDLSCHLTLVHLFLSPRTVHRDFSASSLPPLATLLTRSRVCNTYIQERVPTYWHHALSICRYASRQHPPDLRSYAIIHSPQPLLYAPGFYIHRLICSQIYLNITLLPSTYLLTRSAPTVHATSTSSQLTRI
jgi:hypothetical protein